jgi:hypothetical protein
MTNAGGSSGKGSSPVTSSNARMLKALNLGLAVTVLTRREGLVVPA